MKSLTSLLAGVATLVHGQTTQLEQLTGDIDTVTVSGWNSGATFACMMQVILSDTIQGAICHKGASFGVHSSQVRSTDSAAVVAEISEQRIVELGGQSQIDSISNLANRSVVIRSADNDTWYLPKNQQATQSVFDSFSATTDLNTDTGKNNWWTVHSFENFQDLYESLGYVGARDSATALKKTTNGTYYVGKGEYLDFDQAEFFPGVDFSSTSRDKDFKNRQFGKVFIPTQCKSGTTCKVHVAFNRQNNQPTTLAHNKRYNNIAVDNDIIMVYPNNKTYDFRQNGNDTKDGLLASGILKMIQRVTGTEDECADDVAEAEECLDSIESYLAGEQDTYDSLDDLGECETPGIQARKAGIVGGENFKAYMFNKTFYSGR